ncbi:Uncharacterized protein TPS_00890 [Trichinella pseudospiralis]
MVVVSCITPVVFNKYMSSRLMIFSAASLSHFLDVQDGPSNMNIPKQGRYTVPVYLSNYTEESPAATLHELQRTNH